MAKKASLANFSKIIFMALFLAFGLAAIAITYQAASQKLELRSKAAGEELVIRRWDFTTSSENWEAKFPAVLSVKNGILSVSSYGQPRPEPKILPEDSFGINLFNNNVNTSLPLGNKYLKLRLSVSSIARGGPITLRDSTADISTPVASKPCRQREPCLDDPQKPCRLLALLPGWCPPTPPPKPSPTCVPPPKCAYEGQVNNKGQTVYCPVPSLPAGSKYCLQPTPIATIKLIPETTFRATVSYTSKAGPAVNIGTLEGNADGKFREYILKINEIGPTTIASLNLNFSDLPSPGIVQVDWIMLTGMKPIITTPTPTPTKRPPMPYITPTSTPTKQPRPIL